MSEGYPFCLDQDFTSWFEELAELAKKCNGNFKLPRLELLLSSGNVLYGSVLGFKRGGQDPVLTFQDMEESRSRLTFLRSNQVIGLTLIDAELYYEQFKLPKLELAMGGLEFKRAIQDIESSIRSIIDVKMSLKVEFASLEESNRRKFYNFLALLPMVVEELTQDDLGKKIIKESIGEIIVFCADQLNATFENGTLKIYIPVLNTISKQTFVHDTKVMIEKLL